MFLLLSTLSLLALGYAPFSIPLGYWVRKTQLPVESRIGFMVSPIGTKSHCIPVQGMEGSATEEETDEMLAVFREAEKVDG